MGDLENRKGRAVGGARDGSINAAVSAVRRSEMTDPDLQRRGANAGSGIPALLTATLRL